jgi:hypothetical protein
MYRCGQMRTRHHQAAPARALQIGNNRIEPLGIDARCTTGGTGNADTTQR